MSAGVDVIPGKGNDVDNDTPWCSVETCETIADADAPTPLCLAHLAEAFAYWLKRAEGSAAAIVVVEAKPERKVRRIGTEPGFVYFIRKGDLIKIGWSSQPRKRFHALVPDAVLHLEPGTMRDEKRCHKAFDHLREHGEWFRMEPDLLAFINGLHSKAA